MERAELVRDWLYNNSLTAFVGALLMLLARYVSNKDFGSVAASSFIQGIYPILDSVSPHLTFLHLPLGAILFVLAFALFVASMLHTSPSWAILVCKWSSLLFPIFVWVGLFTAWLPLTGDLFTSEPFLGAFTFYVGFLFLVLMSIRPFVMRVIASHNAAVAEESDLCNNERLMIRNLSRARWQRRLEFLQVLIWLWRSSSGYVASFTEYLQCKMRRHCQDTSRSRTLTWDDVRKGFSLNFGVTLFGLVIFILLIWSFDHISTLDDRIFLTLLFALVPLFTFLDAMGRKAKSRHFDWWFLALVLFLGFALVIATSDEFGLDALGINAVVVLVSSPFLVMFFIMIRRKRLLAIGMVPAAGLLMANTILSELPPDQRLNFILVPLIVVSLLTALWTLLVWILLLGVERYQEHSTLGPFVESLAMLFLFTPLMILAIWVPKTLTGEDTWSTVMGTIVGVLFSSVVSVPLRRFVVRYGNLSSFARLQGRSETRDNY